MKLLHRIGERINSNFNTLNEILACPGPLSFDGIYVSVWNHREQLKGRDITLFFCGAHVASDNTFDVGQPYGKFCNWKEIFDLHFNYGFKLGYHSLTHADLTLLSDAEVVKEVTPPFPMDTFAYPYGKVDERVARIIADAGYKEAYSVTQGNGCNFQKKRSYLNW